MKRIRYRYILIIFFIFASLIGCASTSASHRDASGVLKTKTRTNAGVYKGDR